MQSPLFRGLESKIRPKVSRKNVHQSVILIIGQQKGFGGAQAQQDALRKVLIDSEVAPVVVEADFPSLARLPPLARVLIRLVWAGLKAVRCKATTIVLWQSPSIALSPIFFFNKCRIIGAERSSAVATMTGARRVFYGFCVRRLDLYVVQTERARGVLERIYRCQAVTIANLGVEAGGNSERAAVVGVVSEAPVGTDGRNRWIVTSARLVQSKRMDLVLDAFAAMQSHEGWKLFIAGDGPMGHELKERAKRLHLEETVQFCGQLSRVDLMSLLNSSSVFVSASEREGYPNSLVEASNAGLAIVATDCDYGPSEILSGYPRHVLVKVGDREELQHGLEKVCNGYPAVLNDLEVAAWRSALTAREELAKHQWLEAILGPQETSAVYGREVNKTAKWGGGLPARPPHAGQRYFRRWRTFFT